MKKLASLLLLMMMLCSCSQRTEDVTKEMREASGFRAGAIAQYNEKQYAFTVEKDPESIRVELESPQALKGFSVVLTKGTYEIGYQDVAFRTDKLPENMSRIIGPIFAMCDAIAGQSIEELPDGYITYQMDGVSASCRFDVEAGVPLELRIGDDFLLQFTDFEYN